MQFPQIRISQTNAQIGLRITQPVQEIHQPQAEISIQQVPAEMTIERQPSELRIDQDEAWNQLGLKKLSVLMKDMAAYSRQKGFEAIAKIAAEGEQMAHIELKRDAIVDIAKAKAMPGPADFTIAFIPSYGSVHIQYKPSEIHIDWQLGGASSEYQPTKAVHEYTPGKTEVYLQQRPQLEISFVGGNLNQEA
ncbi:DUF6470 family protein [Neobacillus muris]|uniref:DUF6470 family protein n=1 Tax=Neobacillus muris TaxID=2941334 RepID=UPI00203F0C11|nr:DUF6470 family protein [Neobacillus muris]